MSEAPFIPTALETVRLKPLSGHNDDLAVYEAIQENPEHVDQFGNSVSKHYQTIDQTRKTRLSAEGDLELGIWVGNDYLAGTINARSKFFFRKVEIDYWLRADAVGNGYATIALVALAEHLKPHYLRIITQTHVDNQASSNVARRAGFIKTSTAQRKWGPALIFEYPNQD